MFIPLNPHAYTPNTLHNASPKQANQTHGQGFFTTPGRSPSGTLQRSLSKTFTDVWSQPRLFYNSLHPVERQFLVNAIRFETSQLTSEVVRENVIIQLNRISNDLAKRVARVIGVEAPEPDAKFYHNNKTEVSLGAFGTPLKKLAGLKVGILSSTQGYEEANKIKTALLEADPSIKVSIVAETLIPGGETVTYSAADAIAFDGVIVADSSEKSFTSETSSPLFPVGRPLQIVVDAYRYGKPVAAIGRSGSKVLDNAGIKKNERGEKNGVIDAPNGDAKFAESFLEGLKVFRFLERFEVDADAEN